MRHSSVTQEAEERLHQLQDYIREEPKRFNIDVWGGTVSPEAFYDPDFFDPYKSYYQLRLVLNKQKPPCGSVGCIAGNICILNGRIKPTEVMHGMEVYSFANNFDVEKEAKDVLGITSDQAKNLFYLQKWTAGRYGWPKGFEKELNRYEPGTKEYVDVTCRRIDHFIETGE